MTIALTSPVTGGAQTGFTAPTYTIVAASAPDVNGKQYAVSALGGTQAGVTIHGVSSPFTATFWNPKTYKVLGKPNPVTGVLKVVPMNTYKWVIRKGVTPLVNQPFVTALATVQLDIPAGSDSYDQANVRAMISLLVGALNQQSAGMGDTLVSGLV